MNVPPLQPHNESQPDEQTLSQYAEHTRKSLIARLENWEDQRTWDEFYRTYWRLIYSVALKAGLREDEAWDVVQETILSIAKQSRKNIYKPEQGSFKLWLWNMTRWRINDQFRKRKKDTAMLMNPDAPGTLEHPIDKIPDEGKNNFDQVWEREWQNNLLQAALERVKAKVSPKQFQIFDYYVLREWDAAKVRRQLGGRGRRRHLPPPALGTPEHPQREPLLPPEHRPGARGEAQHAEAVGLDLEVATRHELAEDGPPLLRVELAADPEGRQPGHARRDR